MPDHKRIHSCFAKRRLPSREEARAEVARVQEKYGKAMRLYHCKYCRGFHLATDRTSSS